MFPTNCGLCAAPFVNDGRWLIITKGWAEVLNGRRNTEHGSKVDEAAVRLCNQVLVLGNQWACKDCQTRQGEAERDRQRREARAAAEQSETEKLMKRRMAWYMAQPLSSVQEEDRHRKGMDRESYIALLCDADLKLEAAMRNAGYAGVDWDAEEGADKPDEQESASQEFPSLDLELQYQPHDDPQMSTDLRTQIVGKGFRHLAREHHPDVGGDPAIMRKIISGRDELVAVIQADRTG
jgi:hypothetical protein